MAEEQIKELDHCILPYGLSLPPIFCPWFNPALHPQSPHLFHGVSYLFVTFCLKPSLYFLSEIADGKLLLIFPCSLCSFLGFLPRVLFHKVNSNGKRDLPSILWSRHKSNWDLIHILSHFLYGVSKCDYDALVFYHFLYVHLLLLVISFNIALMDKREKQYALCFSLCLCKPLLCFFPGTPGIYIPHRPYGRKVKPKPPKITHFEYSGMEKIFNVFIKVYLGLHRK